MLDKFLGESTIVKKNAIIAFALLFNTFVWFYMTMTTLDDIVTASSLTVSQNFIIWTTYYLSIILSGIFGSIFSRKTSRNRFLSSWIILGCITSLLLILFTSTYFEPILIISTLLGASLGLGMPACLAYFADYTSVENRGRMGGLVFLSTNLCALFFIVLFGLFSLGVNSILITIWRITGLVLFLKPEKEIAVTEKKKSPSFRSILSDKPFILYFIAWLMFCLIDRFETPIQRNFLGESYDLLLMSAPLLGSISALVGGLLADRIGRKRVALYGFVILGIAYALIGIISTPFISWYLSLGVLFISAGIMWVLFILTLWGDLAHSASSEKLYALGVAPFFLTNIVQLISAEYVTEIPVTSAFSLAAFFLFVAVLPLLYAPETLPEKKMELRRLRSFAEEARKAKEKYEQKKS